MDREELQMNRPSLAVRSAIPAPAGRRSPGARPNGLQFSACSGASSCSVPSDEAGESSSWVTTATGQSTITRALAPASYSPPQTQPPTVVGTSSALGPGCGGADTLGWARRDACCYSRGRSARQHHGQPTTRFLLPSPPSPTAALREASDCMSVGCFSSPFVTPCQRLPPQPAFDAPRLDPGV
jgi:hypothetical protein